MRDFKVNELFDSNNRLCKRELLNNTFTEEDAGRILRIPLTQTPHEDFLIWEENRRVNSRSKVPINYYRVLMQILEFMLYKPSTGNFTKKFGA